MVQPVQHPSDKKIIDITASEIAPYLDILLQDKSTKRNIIWATDSYKELGRGFADTEEITSIALQRHPETITPRMYKSQETQNARTKKRAEVFTPTWLCNQMNNYLDKEWFDSKEVFNTEDTENTWRATQTSIPFDDDKGWKRYIDSRRLEITCGEAPYLTSRYDATTGVYIGDLKNRVGVLDRKMRVVGEHAHTHDEWVTWALRAYESVYGYEYQGDNLLVARINLFLSFIDYYQQMWGETPDEALLRQIVRRIVWNIWQMDGLTNTAPQGKAYVPVSQPTLFDLLPQTEQPPTPPTPPRVSCIIYNWRSRTSLRFKSIKEWQSMHKKLFDYVIGNPPYNEDFENSGDNGKFGKPVYHHFMDAAYELSEKVELIHPARFLFNAGSTPKAWNEKMLNDKHFKVLQYSANSKDIFPNTDIKGG